MSINSIKGKERNYYHKTNSKNRNDDKDSYKILKNKNKMFTK